MANFINVNSMTIIVYVNVIKLEVVNLKSYSFFPLDLIMMVFSIILIGKLSEKLRN